MPERPKYSTGFHAFLAGWVIVAIGLLAMTYGAKSFGGVLLVVGAILTIGFRYPSDWRRTWPDDFPVVARLLGREPRPERWARTPTFWETAPARARRTRSFVLIVVGAALFGWGATNPTDFRHVPLTHTWGFMVGAALMVIGVVQLRRAMRDSRADLRE